MLCTAAAAGFTQPYAICPGVPGALSDSNAARDCCRHFAFAVPRLEAGALLAGQLARRLPVISVGIASNSLKQAQHCSWAEAEAVSDQTLAYASNC